MDKKNYRFTRHRTRFRRNANNRWNFKIIPKNFDAQCLLFLAVYIHNCIQKHKLFGQVIMLKYRT